MKIDVNKLSEEYLTLLKEDIENEIEQLNKKVYKFYSLDDFDGKSFEEIERILISYQVKDASLNARMLSEFINFKNNSSIILSYFEKSRANVEILISKLLESINESSRLEKNNDVVNLNKLKEELLFVNNLSKIFNSKVNLNLDNEFIKEIENLILNSSLSDDDKVSLSFRISSFLVEQYNIYKEAEVVDFEEELDKIIIEIDTKDEELEEELDKIIIEIDAEDEKIEKDDQIKKQDVSFDEDLSIISSRKIIYKDLFEDFGILTGGELVDFYSDGLNIDEVLDAPIIDKSEFVMLVSSILCKICNFKDNDEYQKYKDYLFRIENKFGCANKQKYDMEVAKITASIEDLFNLLSVKYANVGDNRSVSLNLLNEYQQKIFNIDNKIKGEIKNNFLSSIYIQDILKELAVIKSDLEKVQIDVVEVVKSSSTQFVPIKAFVLFDYYDNGEELCPYIMSDLDYKSKDNLIDNMDKKDMQSGYKDFNLLISDLIQIGKSRYVASFDSSVSNGMRIVDRVYYDNDNTKPTGILRIRPRSDSKLRFFEQAVTFRANTRALEQVTTILQKHLPNVQISFDEDFLVYINYASAFKKGSDETYKTAIKRRDYDKSLLVKTFIDNFKHKTELTKTECELFEQMVILTLDSYDKLNKNNDNFNFDFIDSMGGRSGNERK